MAGFFFLMQADGFGEKVAGGGDGGAPLLTPSHFSTEQKILHIENWIMKELSPPFTFMGACYIVGKIYIVIEVLDT